MVILSVVGFSELNLVIFGGDLTLFVTIIVFIQEVKKAMWIDNILILITIQNQSPST